MMMLDVHAKVMPMTNIPSSKFHEPARETDCISRAVGNISGTLNMQLEILSLCVYAYKIDQGRL